MLLKCTNPLAIQDSAVPGILDDARYASRMSMRLRGLGQG